MKPVNLAVKFLGTDVVSDSCAACPPPLHVYTEPVPEQCAAARRWALHFCAVLFCTTMLASRKVPSDFYHCENSLLPISVLLGTYKYILHSLEGKQVT